MVAKVPVIDVVPVSEAVRVNGPYWQVGGLFGFNLTDSVEPLMLPATAPLRSSFELAKAVAQVPVTESERYCTSDSESVPLPRRASEIGPDQLLATPPVVGPVEEFAPQATMVTVPTIMSIRCISVGG